MREHFIKTFITGKFYTPVSSFFWLLEIPDDNYKFLKIAKEEWGGGGGICSLLFNNRDYGELDY